MTTLLRQARRNARRRRTPPPVAARVVRMATACSGDFAGLRDWTPSLLSATCLGRRRVAATRWIGQASRERV